MLYVVCKYVFGKSVWYAWCSALKFCFFSLVSYYHHTFAATHTANRATRARTQFTTRMRYPACRLRVPCFSLCAPSRRDFIHTPHSTPLSFSSLYSPSLSPLSTPPSPTATDATMADEAAPAPAPAASEAAAPEPAAAAAAAEPAAAGGAGSDAAPASAAAAGGAEGDGTLLVCVCVCVCVFPHPLLRRHHPEDENFDKML